MSGKTLLDCFSALEDPRQACKVVYPLEEILLLALCATMAGADDFVEIALWGQEKIGFLRRFYPYANGLPSHDTLNDVFNALPTGVFSECFMQWTGTLRADARFEVVAVDGKTSRRAHGTGADGRRALHMVSAWASRQRMVLGQTACAEKSNEITAIPELLARLELAGALVTADAMGCQTQIAAKIREKGADYLLALKDNQPQLHDEVRLFFDTFRDRCERFETLEKDHGRIEKRVHHVSHDTGWLLDRARSAGGWKFAGLSMVAMVESAVERGGRTERQTRHYLCSAPLTAAQFAAAVRSHWHVENRLHWVLDVVFHDDLTRLRTGHGPANMSVLRHFAVTLVHGVNDKNSLKSRRKKLAWNEDFLHDVITGKRE